MLSMLVSLPPWSFVRPDATKTCAGILEQYILRYMMPPSRFMGSLKKRKTLADVIGCFLSPAATLATTNARSSSVSHFTSSGKSLTKKKAAIPTTMVARPSSIKTQRQFFSPPMPSIFAIALAKRPPNAPATMVELK
jgi:hypothetical protein